ncbi:pre-mRNA 3'-end-processing factor FIP1 isoform X3 [Oryzias melastigma]|uniref:pre-mRNA 3'-end-processing factor FIP1 isoform X3 n=1 Tax=Oryzias melastigma TaxID=30732 RepID=UPI000CF7B75A|nr:pre-mRNA 3'-end-processing factor FIP1 isoform X3 [Oryzias melastigma]
MSSSANSAEASEEDEEGKLYQYIYELKEDTGETERTPVCSSPKNSPVRLEIHVERRTLTAETPKMRRLKKAKGIKKSVQTREPSQKKPWNEPSANVSDYFNYGFTEDTWKAYCKKQTKLQGFKQSQKLQVMAQKTRTGVKAEESVSAENVSGKPAAVASSRKSEANGGVRNGPSGSRSRKKSSPCYRARGAQEVSDTSHEENSSPFYEKPHGDSTRRLFPLVSPPSFLFQPRSGYGSSFCTSTLSSRQADSSDVPLKPRFQCSSGNSTPSSGLTETTQAWSRRMRQRKLDRGREHDLDKENTRERNRKKLSSSSSSHHRRSSMTRSHKYSRVKEQTKAWSSKDEHHRGCRFKDLMGENRRTDRNRKPDSSRRSCNRTNEEKTMAQDAKRRKKKMKSKKTSIALADQKGL